MVAGVVVIIIGAILLLNEFGVFPHGLVLQFWPMVFVVVGLLKLFSANDWAERVVGVCLIGVGTILQTNSLGLTHVSFNQVWPLSIIVVGVMLVIHSMSDKGGKFTTDPHSNSFYVFGGGERQVNAKDFRGSKMFAVFGGYEVDLTRAEMASNDAFVEANAIFGGGEIRIPTNWKVVMQGMGIFGGYNDKTHYLPSDPSAPVKTLYVRGVAMFGGVEVKN
jgi:predicted membrane protein